MKVILFAVLFTVSIAAHAESATNSQYLSFLEYNARNSTESCSASNCSGGFTCREGACVCAYECCNDSDCKNGQFCGDGICRD